MSRRVTLSAIATLLIVAGVGVAVGADPTESPWAARRVLNVAHAGGDLEAPHSTLFAMHSAVNAGTDVLEMDVRLSSDGVLMVHHDETLDRTTNATGPMSELTAAELQALDNAYWFVPDCWSCHDRPAEEYEYRGVRTGDQAPPPGFEPTDFAIPTLQQVADTFPDRVLDVEIKDGPTGIAAAEALAEFIAANGPTDRYLVASFDDSILAHFSSLAPDTATSPGLDTMLEWFVTRGPLPEHDVLQVPPTYTGIDVVTPQFVADAHANGLAVWVWFNGSEDDSEPTWRALIDAGVDALLTGKPAAAQAVIEDDSVEFSVAPALSAGVGVRGRTATLDVSCPALHVARCKSRLVAVAADRTGRFGAVGTTDFEVARGSQAEVAMTLTNFGRQVLQAQPLPAYALLVPGNDDTAPLIVAIELRRG